MIIIGLVLLVAAAVVGLDLVWKNHFAIRSPALFGQTLGIHSAAAFFVVGAICGAVVILGFALMLAGLRRRGRKAKQHRIERKDARQTRRERDRVQQENDRLRNQAGNDHDVTDTRSPGATTAD